jgi:hypothetical protein
LGIATAVIVELKPDVIVGRVYDSHISHEKVKIQQSSTSQNCSNAILLFHENARMPSLSFSKENNFFISKI